MARVSGALSVLGANFGASVNGSFLESYICDELDKCVGVVNDEDVDIRFDDLETGMSSEDETLITIAKFVVTMKRTTQWPHT